MKRKYFILYMGWTFLFITSVTYAQTKNKEVNMRTEEANKEVVRKMYEQSLNKRDFELLKELVADEYVGIKGIKGVAGIEAAAVPLIKSFPDIQWKIEELIADGNKVVVKWKWQGVSQSPYQNLSATNKVISNEAIGIYELKDGRITAAQLLTDRLGFMQQMEAIPPDINLITNQKIVAGEVQFIDKFLIPAKSKQAFTDRMNINRDFIKKLPGFIEDHAYERLDEKGNSIVVTIAIWESEQAVKNAKDKVQDFYKKEGFDMVAFLHQLQITIDRGLYKTLD